MRISDWSSDVCSSDLAAPTAPPAPGRFSTTTGWPSSLAKGTASARAMTSLLAPGAKGTISWIDLEGQAGSVLAWLEDTASSPPARIQPHSCRLELDLLVFPLI